MTELRLMAVHAHPDDESSKGAATLARYADEGRRVMVVTLTGGERGDILNPALDSPEFRDRIADVRRLGLQRFSASNITGSDSSTPGCPRVTRCLRCRTAASRQFRWTSRWPGWSR